jgi:hypothetical protein
MRSRSDIDVGAETRVGSCCDDCLAKAKESRISVEQLLERRELRAEV